MEIQGKIVVITGIRRGIGKSLADKLRREGAIVIGCSLHGTDDIASVDVQNASDVDVFIRDVIEHHGHIDCLINNAGVAHGAVNFEDISLEEYERCMRTNIDGVAFGMRAVLPSMKRHNSGTIINICSKAGSRAHPTLSAYCASKFAVLGLTQAVAKELCDAGSAVRCFTVSPGGVNTDMRERLFGEKDAHSQQSIDTVSDLIIDFLSRNTSIENGVDIQIVRGEISAKVAMQ